MVLSMYIIKIFYSFIIFYLFFILLFYYNSLYIFYLLQNIPIFPDPFGLFDIEDNSVNNSNKFPIGFQNPMTMPMIMIRPKRNLKGFDGPNKKTPIDVFKSKTYFFL